MFCQKIRQRFSSVLKIAKRQIVYCLLLCGVILYACIGGVVFYELEYAEAIEIAQVTNKSFMECSLGILSDSETARLLVDRCCAPYNTISSWSRVRGLVFAYASMITLGYGRVTLMTQAGRIFYIVYCIIGMPVGLVFLANLGKFIEKGVGYIVEGIKRCIKRKKLKNKTNPEESDKEEHKPDEKEDFELGGLFFLILFFFYIAMGVFAMCFFDTYNVVDGMFLNFMALTAMDATSFLGAKGIFLLIGLVYVTGGLALVTVAISVLGKYLNYLQSIGKKLKGTRMKKVWFGGKEMYVNDLIHTVTDEFGLDRSQIDNLDLDKLIEKQLNGTEEEKPVALEEEIFRNMDPTKFSAATFAQGKQETGGDDIMDHIERHLWGKLDLDLKQIQDKKWKDPLLETDSVHEPGTEIVQSNKGQLNVDPEQIYSKEENTGDIPSIATAKETDYKNIPK